MTKELKMSFELSSVDFIRVLSVVHIQCDVATEQGNIMDSELLARVVYELLDTVTLLTVVNEGNVVMSLTQSSLLCLVVVMDKYKEFCTYEYQPEELKWISKVMGVLQQ